MTTTTVTTGLGLTRLQHLVLWVSDVERSVRFYRDVLGFEVKSQSAARRIPANPGQPGRPPPRPVRAGGRGAAERAGRPHVPLRLGSRRDHRPRRARGSAWSRRARWSARPITASACRSTRRIRTGSSSRSSGRCPAAPRPATRALDLEGELVRRGSTASLTPAVGSAARACTMTARRRSRRPPRRPSTDPVEGHMARMNCTLPTAGPGADAARRQPPGPQREGPRRVAPLLDRDHGLSLRGAAQVGPRADAAQDALLQRRQRPRATSAITTWPCARCPRARPPRASPSAGISCRATSA